MERERKRERDRDRDRERERKREAGIITKKNKYSRGSGRVKTKSESFQ